MFETNSLSWYSVEIRVFDKEVGHTFTESEQRDQPKAKSESDRTPPASQDTTCSMALEEVVHLFVCQIILNKDHKQTITLHRKSIFLTVQKHM